MLSSKFKDDMLAISGITFTKTGGIQYYRGLNITKLLQNFECVVFYVVYK